MGKRPLSEIFTNSNGTGTGFGNSLTPLQRAVKAGDFNKVCNLVEKGANIHAISDIGTPEAMVMALINDQVEIFEYLLQHTKHPFDINAMHFGAKHGQKREHGLLEYLTSIRLPRNVKRNADYLTSLALKHGADPYDKIYIGFSHRRYTTPMHLAILTENLPVLKTLLKDPNIDLHKSFSRINILEYAFIENKRHAMKELLKADPTLLNTKDQNGQSNFMMLMKKADYDTICDILNNYDIEIAATDLQRNGVLHAVLDNVDVAGYQQDVLLNKLMLKGADIYHQNRDGETILHKLAKGGSRADMDKMASYVSRFSSLTATDKGLDQKDRNGRTALFAACIAASKYEKSHEGEESKFHRYMVDMLLRAGADPNQKDRYGYTILDRLAERGDRDSLLVQRLTKSGAGHNKLYSPEELKNLKSMVNGDQVKPDDRVPEGQKRVIKGPAISPKKDVANGPLPPPKRTVNRKPPINK